jgi:hypothetical protein
MSYTIDVEPADFIWIDLFPAAVSIGNSEQPPISEELRVIVTNNYFYVIDDTIDGPAAIIKEPLADFDGSNKTGYTVITSSGQEYYFIRATNCGCGSRIRGIFPFPGVPFVARSERK